MIFEMKKRRVMQNILLNVGYENHYGTLDVNQQEPQPKQ